MRAKAWIMAAVVAGVPLVSGIVEAHPASATAPQEKNVVLDYTITGLTGTLDVHYGNGTGVAYGAVEASDGSMTSVRFNDPDGGNGLVVTSAGGSLTARVHERVLIPERDDTLRGTGSYVGGTVQVSVNFQRPVSVPNGSFSFDLFPSRHSHGTSGNGTS